MGFDFTSYLTYLEISRNLEISSYFYNFANQRNFDLTSAYFFILVEMMHYFVSGLVEFIKLYNFNLSDFVLILVVINLMFFSNFLVFLVLILFRSWTPMIIIIKLDNIPPS